jgi:hypothetical protein
MLLQARVVGSSFPQQVFNPTTLTRGGEQQSPTRAERTMEIRLLRFLLLGELVRCNSISFISSSYFNPVIQPASTSFAGS